MSAADDSLRDVGFLREGEQRVGFGRRRLEVASLNNRSYWGEKIRRSRHGRSGGVGWRFKGIGGNEERGRSGRERIEREQANGDASQR